MAPPAEPPVNPNESDEIEIDLRPPAEVVARLLLLAVVLRRAYLETGRLAPEDDPTGERFDLAAWAGAEGLLDHATPTEREFVRAPLGSLPADAVSHPTWQAEALSALGWALGLVPALPREPVPTDPGLLLASLPVPWDSTRPVFDGATLRDEESVAVERERAEIWLWRVESELAHREGSPAEQREIEAAVREVAADAARAGLIASLASGDFPFDGRAFRRASEEALEDVAEVAIRRLRALNWLCGFGTTWDDVPLDI